MRVRTLQSGFFAAMLAATAASLSGAASAEVPAGLTHQGRLFDAQAQPIDEALKVTFALYDDVHAELPVWVETHLVAFEDGYFSVRLGEKQPLTSLMTGAEALYLGITVGEDEEMTPRSQVSSVPFSLVCGEVPGHIHPRAVSIGDLLVINEKGRWVGDPTGLVGPAGSQGPEGPAGPEGKAGPVGPTGKTGPAGLTGKTGPAGPTGKTGPVGPDGRRGESGAPGAEGPMGPEGPQGPQGPDGPRGPEGLQGPEGPMGPMGLQGPEGPMGPMGSMGPKGLQGPEGPMGPQGLPGPDGAVGPMGPTGQDGAQGAVGPEGPEGPQGPQGSPGSPVQIVPFWQQVTAPVSPSATDFVFVGGSQTIWLQDTSVVSGVLQAPLGSTEANEQSVFGTPFLFDVCFQPTWASVVVPFAAAVSPAAHLDARPLSWMAAGAVTLPPGAYEVGFCIKNSSDLLVDMYSAVTGYFQISTPAVF